ncbi:MAG: glycosyltransferase [Anaerolineae bacterium]|nr:glycosyltransferase [Anaerolineae bacterium]MDW8173491.1 glycosyltransferase [Anaerolineae bacterium]
MKLALVHDWLNQMGGAEDVLEELVDMFPGAPIYTSLYAPDLMPAAYRAWDIRTLWTNHLPQIHRRHQVYLPAYPLAWSSLDLSAYEIILSNKSGFCHGLRAGQALHICYCLTPTRYVWQLDAYIAREGLGRATELALRPLVALLRRWDYAAAQRVTHFIAISTEVQARIRHYYNRDSVVIFPPIQTSRFVPVPSAQVEDYYLIVSRLIPYKRIDLAIEAANRLGLRLKIVGRGRDLARLQALSGPTVEFLGYVPDEDLPDMMARCRAFIFPGLEDFGITPVQAAAAGRPTIAYGGGGALDTVIPGLNGVHFCEQTTDSLAEALARFDPSQFDPLAIRRHAQRFDAANFRAQLRAFVDQALEAQRSGQPFTWRDPLATQAT